MTGWLIHSPARLMAAVANILFLAFALALWATLAMPGTGIGFSDGADGVTVTLPDAAPVIVARKSPVVIESRAGRFVAPAGEMVRDYMPDGTPDALNRWYRDRDRISRIATAPDARIHIGGELSQRIATRPRHLADLPLDFWLLSLQGLLIGGLGLWMRIHRPRDPAAWMFALSCDGVAMAGFSGAIFDARDLSADGWLLQAMQTLNFVGVHMCSLGLLLFFLLVPRRLVRARRVAPLLVLAPLLGVAEGLGIVPRAGFYLVLLLTVAASAGVFTAQWLRARKDPVARAALRWIGSVTFAGAALLSVGMAVPILWDVAPLASDGMSVLPVAVMFGGIAFGIGGARVFELEPWSVRLGLGTVAVMAVMAMDALLGGLLNLGQGIAIGTTLLIVGYLYLPFRALVLRHFAGHRAMSGDQLFRMATDVAFAPDAEAQLSGWRRLHDRLFDPLDNAVADQAAARAVIEEEGRGLTIPAVAGLPALRLRFARRGRRLFGSAERRMAQELVALMAKADEARAAYARGVNEERHRIARDLHDDVSALLLTGLHRSDVESVRGDVRQAMAEIRTMIQSLSGDGRPLADILADIRYEASQRLSAGGIALDWPVDGAMEQGGAVVGYAAHKAIHSAFREVVSNILRHAAGADRVAVRVAMDGDRLEITVRDDGIGLASASAPAPGQRTGHGLANIDARLREIGGACRILPERSGFALVLILPLDAPAR